MLGNHRLHREHHARDQPHPMSRTTVVGHLRGLVQVPADAMPDIFVHHAEPAFLHIGLHRTANVTDPRTHPHHRKSGLQAFAGGIQDRKSVV